MKLRPGKQAPTHSEQIGNEKGPPHKRTKRSSERNKPPTAKPAALQSNSPLFALPAELRNEIYFFMAEDTGVLRTSDRASVTSVDPLSLTCKLVRHEYLDVLWKKTQAMAGPAVGVEFSHTFLLRHTLADPNQRHSPKRRRRGTSAGGRGRRA